MVSPEQHTEDATFLRQVLLLLRQAIDMIVLH